MNILFAVLIIIASVLLILIVLVQNSKGGGLASNLSSSNQIMGVRKTADFLEKATWGLAIALLVFSISASVTMPLNQEGGESAIKDQIENATDYTQAPAIPTQEQVEQQLSNEEATENN